MSITKTPRGLIPTLLITSILATASLPLTAAAQPDESEGQRGKRRGPPPEAIEACANQSEGEACSFTGRRGDMTGICFAPPREDAVLACAPEGGPPGHREGEKNTDSE
ncbi:MAG: hypothetical protein NWP69_13150 [Congregibacter sp.]|nr:hypothetical protein [Congregibacter sp.]